MFNWCEWGMSFFALMNFEQGLEGYFESQHLWFDQWENARYVNEKQDLKATWEVVCYTAVLSVVTQRSSPLTAAFPLCLRSNEQTNHGASKRARFSVFDKSINRRWISTGSVFSSNEKVNLQKGLF